LTGEEGINDKGKKFAADPYFQYNGTFKSILMAGNESTVILGVDLSTLDGPGKYTGFYQPSPLC
jgi:hypothetical protein